MTCESQDAEYETPVLKEELSIFPSPEEGKFMTANIFVPSVTSDYQECSEPGRHKKKTSIQPSGNHLITVLLCFLSVFSMHIQFGPFYCFSVCV